MRTALFLLGALDDDDIDWLIDRGDRQRLPAGSVLIQEGVPLSHLFILLDGALSVSVAATGGRAIANLLSGDIVGEMSFIDTQLPSATVTATQDSLVLRIEREELAQRLHLDVGFAARFYNALAISLSTRLRVTVGRLKHLNLPPASDSDFSFHDLAPDIQDTVTLAHTRLDWILRRINAEAKAP